MWQPQACGVLCFPAAEARRGYRRQDCDPWGPPLEKAESSRPTQIGPSRGAGDPAAAFSRGLPCYAARRRMLLPSWNPHRKDCHRSAWICARDVWRWPAIQRKRNCTSQRTGRKRSATRKKTCDGKICWTVDCRLI
ncbi:hypothetical protein GUJ93_ZPchr0011g28358 [Zizania palustris]|uniref:Uncharacterized protein n=1 Tax=Zizania palustris TaxID=103762 RepID=A0A8J5WGS8_ZIZPA|nr:hypothetical protein GUJ93_ZPchr0011g28358 [Zizania palustris]